MCHTSCLWSLRANNTNILFRRRCRRPILRRVFGQYLRHRLHDSLHHQLGLGAAHLRHRLHRLPLRYCEGVYFLIQRAGGGQEGPYAHSLGTHRVRSHDFHLGSRQYRREYLRPRRLLCAAIADVIVYERYPHSARKLIDTIHRSVTITSLITNKSGRAPMDNCAT